MVMAANTHTHIGYYVKSQNENELVKAESLFYDLQPNYATKWRTYSDNYIPHFEVLVSEPDINLIADELSEKISNLRPRLFINPAKSSSDTKRK